MKKIVQSEFSNPKSFENIVRLAAYVCGTRSAMINCLDNEFQWTLFNVGWDNAQIPKENSICQLTEIDSELLYIPNTDKDKRLQKIEAVQEDPNIKFYAGVGFQATEDMKGTLCVIDDKPSKLTDMQKEALKTLASEVEARMNLISEKQRLQKKNEELEKKSYFLKNSADILLIVEPDSLLIEEVHTEIDTKFVYTSRELEGNRITQYLKSSDYARRLRKWRNDNELGVLKYETKFLTKSGGHICLLLHTSLVGDKLYITGKDISERKVAEQLLLKEKRLSDGIIENLPGIFCLIDKDGKIIRLNKNMKSVTGHDNKEIDNESIFSFISDDQVDFVKQKFKENSKKGSAHAECKIVSKTGEKIPFVFSRFRYEIENEPFTVLLGINISEEKRALKEIEDKEVKLQKAYQRLNNAQHIAKMGSWEWDVENNKLYWSDETYKILQFDKKKHLPSLDLLFERLPPPAKERMESAIERALNGTNFKSVEHDVILPDGNRIHVQERGEAILDDEGNVIKISGSVQDVTIQKNVESELKKALEEREVMLKEIHHRVKNNLAVVSGLLQLELGFGDDIQVNYSLQKSIGRIKSMAAIHEHLYKSQSFTSISFDSFISQLVNIIRDLYQEKSEKIKLNIQSDEMDLNINQAIPCALILNELISNSFKHAFKDKKEGWIDITMSLESDIVEIIVKDNGVGIDENIDPEKSTSLGLTLLEILSKQLHAEYEITVNKGTKVQLRFKKDQNVRGASGNQFA